VTRSLLFALMLSASAGSAWAAPGPSRRTTEAAPASTRYVERVRAFLALQKELGSALSARKGATPQGAIFTPIVAAQFRAIILTAFQGPQGSHIRRTILEGDPVTPTALRVNEAYPEDIPSTTMPPTLLRRLPALPADLAYRIVGRALVLQDIRDNMIVDVLPDAIPVVR